MLKRIITFFLLLTTYISYSQTGKPIQVDVCVYGGTSGGVIAAYTAKRMGKTVLLIEPGKHLGGMSSGGLGQTDIGNKYAITGLSRDFYRRIGQHYGRFEQWTFEPHVAENLFKEYIQKGKVEVLYSHRIISASKNGTVISQITLENSEKPDQTTNRAVSAKMFIDCSYEGDLMAKAGVSYIVGREDNSQYNETLSGVQLLDKHQFPEGIDPYVISGNPSSGLVYGVSKEELKPNGTGDTKVQAYNFRMCLTNVSENRIPIAAPPDYDPKKYELVLRQMEKRGRWRSLDEDLMHIAPMPNNKTDINNRGGMSTDFIGANWDYPEAYYAKRAQIWEAHKNYTMGFFYFLGHDPKVPQHIRNEMLTWGYPKDEYQDTGGWSHQLYVREARRMIGEYVMTQHNCQGREVVSDGVGMAAYTMDSHNIQRLVVNGFVKNEGDVQVGGFGPYPISYRSIIPKTSECTNLLVPVCLSATHIAYGSIRMEPVFMVLGQSAAVAASMAIDKRSSVQKVDVQALQGQLKSNPLADNSQPEILVDNDDKINIHMLGDWVTNDKLYNRYGVSLAYLNTSATPSKNHFRFLPSIAKTGKYKVYVYCPQVENQAASMKVFVKSATGVKENTIDTIKNANEWVLLGDFTFQKGTEGYIEVSPDKESAGTIVADAILLIPG
jgi:hypothetical protein